MHDEPKRLEGIINDHRLMLQAMTETLSLMTMAYWQLAAIDDRRKARKLTKRLKKILEALQDLNSMTLQFYIRARKEALVMVGIPPVDERRRDHERSESPSHESPG